MPSFDFEDGQIIPVGRPNGKNLIVCGHTVSLYKGCIFCKFPTALSTERKKPPDRIETGIVSGSDPVAIIRQFKVLFRKGDLNRNEFHGSVP
jgi:hypothetical protein